MDKPPKRKYNLPPLYSGMKQIKPSDRQKISDRLVSTIQKIFGDSEIPICDVKCNIEQGITESTKLLQVEQEKSLNGTFTILVEINGGAQNILEEDELINIRRIWPHGLRIKRKS